MMQFLAMVLLLDHGAKIDILVEDPKDLPAWVERESWYYVRRPNAIAQRQVSMFSRTTYSEYSRSWSAAGIDRNCRLIVHTFSDDNQSNNMWLITMFLSSCSSVLIQARYPLPPP